MNDLNLNIDQQTLEACLKEINNLGSTTYVNICNGSSQTVSWGTMEWGGVIFAFLLGSFVFLMIAGLLIWYIQN